MTWNKNCCLLDYTVSTIQNAKFTKESEMKSLTTYTGFMISFLLLTGCGPIHPTDVPLGLHDMTTFYSSEPISLINAQEVNEIKITDNTKTNLSEWTNQAIVLIKQWFEQNNIQVVEGSNKYLKVSIPEVSIDPKSNMCTNVTLHIETGTGFERSYTARGCAGGVTHNRSAGYAINYAVVDMMHDGSILKYLSD
jgi:hypothetical protein